MNPECKSEQQALLERQCLSYIKSNPVLGRVLKKLIHKYESYGEVVGRVPVGKITREELELLEGFCQKNYHGKKNITISAKDLEKALEKSCFATVSLQRLLELYADEELKSKSEQKEAYTKQWNKLISAISAEYEGTVATKWLADILNTKKYGYQYLQGVYRERQDDQEEVKKIVRLGCDILNGFPCRERKLEYLPIFATRLTSNPHAFDMKTVYGNYLVQLLQWESVQIPKRECKTSIFTSLENQRLYLSAGILRDDISNYVVISGIKARKQDGMLHQGMEGFYQEEDTVQVPLSVLATWEEVTCIDSTLYIVENPSVYGTLLTKWRGTKSLMCMNGQPKLSALVLLDLLSRSTQGNRIYYAGDFDPEGLLIAQKLKKYYQGIFSYWHMELEDYQASQSQEKISEKRLASLNQIDDPLLNDIVERMGECKLAGYQEKIIDRYYQ